jgi:four helix bundle protein
MELARSFRELEVYKTALQQAEIIFVLTRGFPQEEQQALTSQMRASARAVSTLLAAAWARRTEHAAFVGKMQDVAGEVMATQAWLDHACICGYIDVERHRELDDAWQRVRTGLQRLLEPGMNVP